MWTSHDSIFIIEKPSRCMRMYLSDALGERDGDGQRSDTDANLGDVTLQHILQFLQVCHWFP